MNIFVLDYDPTIAAQMASDKHNVKMILESAQLLCTAVRLNGGNAPYRITHRNHPCTKWASKNKANWNWLKEYAMALCEEYTHRYGKVHKSQPIISQLTDRSIPDGKLTPFPLCMPPYFRKKDVVESYRNYYINGKKYMNKGKGPQWNKDPSRLPSWYAP